MGEDNENKPVQVTPLSLGVAVRGGLMCNIIPRNSPTPTKVEMVFCTTADDQTGCEIRVRMGERVRAVDNMLLKAFTLSEFPPTPKNVTIVKVCFEIDSNGILTVSSQIVSQNKALTCTKVTSKCEKIWPEKEKVEEMVRTAKECESEDVKHKEKVNAMNGLLDYVYVIEKQLKRIDVNDNCKKIVPLEIERLEIAIEKAKSVETVEEIRLMRKEIETISDSILLLQKKSKKKKKVHSLIRVIKSWF